MQLSAVFGDQELVLDRHEYIAAATVADGRLKRNDHLGLGRNAVFQGQRLARLAVLGCGRGTGFRQRD